MITLLKLTKLHLLFLIIFQICEWAKRLKRLSEVRSFALDARNLKNFRGTVASCAGHAHLVTQHVQIEFELRCRAIVFAAGSFIEFGHVFARRGRRLTLLPFGELILEFDCAVASRSEDIG